MNIKNTLEKIEMPVRAVIFDIDGVVLDTFRDQYGFVKQSAERYGGEQPFPQYGDAYRARYNAGYRRGNYPGIYEEFGMDFNKFKGEIWKDFNEYYANRLTPTCSVDGYSVADAVQEIFKRGAPSTERHTRLRLAINTTKSHKNIYPSLSAANIWNCFDTVVEDDDIVEIVGDSIGKKNGGVMHVDKLREEIHENVTKQLGKPGSLSALLAINRLGVRPESVIVFEDTYSGIQTYKPALLHDRRHNIYVVAVSWGFESPEELTNADAIIHSPKEMVEIIKLLGGFS